LNCDLRRLEHHVKIGRRYPSLLPGDAKARQPKLLPTEGQTQQQYVKQEGKQECDSQPPAVSAHASARLMAASKSSVVSVEAMRCICMCTSRRYVPNPKFIIE